MKNKIQSLLHVEDSFGAWFMATGIAVQFLAFLLSGETLLSLISGIAGVVSVILCSQRKLSFYFWSLMQIVTFVAVSMSCGLYGKLVENIFYVGTLGFGLLHWNLHITKGKVQTRQMSMPTWRFTLLITTICYMVAYYFLDKAGGTHPALDGFTTVFAIAAQVLMILRYAENWFLWFMADVACIILFAKVGDWCMVAQYLFWTANCVYGYLKWRNGYHPIGIKAT